MPYSETGPVSWTEDGENLVSRLQNEAAKLTKGNFTKVSMMAAAKKISLLANQINKAQNVRMGNVGNTNKLGKLKGKF